MSKTGDVLYDKGTYGDACAAATAISSEVPTEEDRGLVEFVLSHAHYNRPTAAQAATHAAALWEDLALWSRALAVAQGGDILPPILDDGTVASALEAFGLDKLKPRCVIRTIGATSR